LRAEGMDRRARADRAAHGVLKSQPGAATRSRTVLDTRLSLDDLVPLVVRCSTNGCCRRVSPVAVHPGEGPLTERTAGVQPARREQVFMPQRRPLPGPRGSIGQPGKQSFDRAASLLPHDGTTAKTGRRHRAVVHDQDADTHDAASAIVAPKVRGSRTVNSVNSLIWLSTVIVPLCSWVTMS